MIRGQWYFHGEGLLGFVQNDANPEPLWVELLADKEPMAIALANLPQPQNCGFYFNVPSALLDEDVELQVRVANTAITLEKAQDTSTGPLTGLTGELLVDRGLTFSGWVVDPSRKEEKLNIYAWISGTTVAHTVAGGRCYRPAQADGHGFTLELPARFSDGASYIVNLRDEKGREIPGSPVRVRALPEYSHKWLKQQKKIDKPLLDLMCGMMESLEERLPGVIGHGNYEDWKKAFPLPPVPKQKQKIGITGETSLIKNQQGCDLKNGTDCMLLAGGASRLHNYAIAHMYDNLIKHQASLVFADAETPDGFPLFKPAWDREAFLAQNYLGPCLLNGKFARQFKPGIPQSEAFRLIMEAAQSGPVVHLPMPLSVTPAPALSDAHLSSAAQWLAANDPAISASEGRIYYKSEQPLVSIIIPTRDHGELLKTCLDSLWPTDWANLEILIVDNGSKEEDALHIMREAATRENVRLLNWPHAFNYAAINNMAVGEARGELVCFLNNDTEALNPAWLREMASMLLALEAGCIGAKLLWPNGLVQHGGVIVGTHQLAAHVGNQWLQDEPGYMNRNLHAQQYSAVTAACLLTPRKLFMDLGGFDARRFPVAFNDVDYCLRVGKSGKKVYWTPHALLAHHESASRGKDQSDSARARSEKEIRTFRTIWGHYLDPYYNPNLHLSVVCEPFLGMAFPPRSREPRLTQP